MSYSSSIGFYFLSIFDNDLLFDVNRFINVDYFFLFDINLFRFSINIDWFFNNSFIINWFFDLFFDIDVPNNFLFDYSVYGNLFFNDSFIVNWFFHLFFDYSLVIYGDFLFNDPFIVDWNFTVDITINIYLLFNNLNWNLLRNLNNLVLLCWLLNILILLNWFLNYLNSRWLCININIRSSGLHSLRDGSDATLYLT